MLLEGKTAVVYGGGGSVGGAAAWAFAREGATVFLAGRTREPLDKVASDIEGSGGRAEVAELDALSDVGNAAAFLASDLAATTATVFNLTSGTIAD